MALKELIERIDELQSQIQAQGKLDNETLKRINYKFRLDWNYNSNVMEGNSLTKLETRSVMINNITLEGKPLKDVIEMRGHDTTITDILKIGKGELNLSESRIIEIHKGIMYEDNPEKKKDIGVWKKDNNYLYNYKNERIDFTPHTEVKDKMHELINWLNTQKEKISSKDKKALHPVVLAFEFHLRYVTIHPFYDGNGRTARIFTNLILIAFGYPPVIIKLEEKDKYYQYLGDVQAYGGSPDLFYEFMSALLARSEQIVLDAIEGKDIEEPDDIDKEILLWKKQATTNKITAIRKANNLVYDIYINGIRKLIDEFEKKHRQFYDLFQSKEIYYYLNGDTKKELEELSNTIDGLITNLQGGFVNAGELPQSIEEKDTCYNIGISISLEEYKFSSSNPFHISSILDVELQPYKYVVSHNVNMLLEKPYSDFISNAESATIITRSLREMLEQIKAETMNK